MSTRDDAVRDVRVAARRMQDSPALVMLPLHDGSGACSDSSAEGCPYGFAGLGTGGLQPMESIEVEGMQRPHVHVGQQHGAAPTALPAKAAAPAHADSEPHQSLTVPFLEEHVRLVPIVRGTPAAWLLVALHSRLGELALASHPQ